MLGRRRIIVAIAAIAALALPAATDPGAAALAAWTVAIPQQGALFIATPRSDGQMVVVG